MSTKYQVVADAIRERIKNGTYKIDELIPDQNALAQEFHVNRLTVKKALDGLAAEGLIYKQSGLGTYVRGKIPFITPHDVSVNDFGGSFHRFGEGHIQSKVISFDVELPDERIQKNLSIKHIDPVYNITRLRIVDGKPTVLEHTYMPVRLVPDLEREHVDTSIYKYINETLGLKFGGAFRKFSAFGASGDDIKYLEVEEGSPILELEQLVWLSNGKMIEYSTSRNPGNLRSYTALNVTNF